MSSFVSSLPMSPAALLVAFRRLLRPLIRLMLRSGITFPVLADVLRQLFVDVAATEILTQPQARTDSRLSLITGIHRKEIRRFREMPPDPAEVPQVVTIASQIIARWTGAAPWVDEAGQPRPLRRAATPNDATPSFEALVSSVTTDIRPRAVLDDWLAQDLVHLASGDHVVLNTNVFIPRPGGEEQLFYFARNLHDHVAAAVANIIASDAAPFLDRSVHYDELTAIQARELEQYARDAAMRALLDVNRKALELLETHKDPAADRVWHRVNFGAFVFAGVEPPALPSLAGAAA